MFCLTIHHSCGFGNCLREYVALSIRILSVLVSLYAHINSCTWSSTRAHTQRHRHTHTHTHMHTRTHTHTRIHSHTIKGTSGRVCTRILPCTAGNKPRRSTRIPRSWRHRAAEAKGDEEHLPGASGIPEAALGSGRKLDDWVITCKTTTFITVEQ